MSLKERNPSLCLQIVQGRMLWIQEKRALVHKAPGLCFLGGFTHLLRPISSHFPARLMFKTWFTHTSASWSVYVVLEDHLNGKTSLECFGQSTQEFSEFSGTVQGSLSQEPNQGIQKTGESVSAGALQLWVPEISLRDRASRRRLVLECPRIPPGA